MTSEDRQFSDRKNKSKTNLIVIYWKCKGPHFNNSFTGGTPLLKSKTVLQKKKIPLRDIKSFEI